MRSVYLLLAILLLPTSVHAGTSNDALPRAQTPSAKAIACGTTIDDNLAASENALSASDQTTQSLHCLIVATRKLSTQLNALYPIRQEQHEHRVLHAPVIDGPVDVKRQ